MSNSIQRSFDPGLHYSAPSVLALDLGEVRFKEKRLAWPGMQSRKRTTVGSGDLPQFEV